MAAPHDSWAHLYDDVHRLSFGEFYDNLTAATVALLERVAPPPSRVLDIGAGNGRLALPLARRGCRVVAVEPARRLAAELGRRALGEGLAIDVRVAAAQDFEPASDCDQAIAVFTVMNYLLDDAALQALAERVVQSLRPGGTFLFDLADRELFADCVYEEPDFRRRVRMRPVPGSDGLFDYDERTEGVIDGEPFAYEDAVRLRCWEADEVLPIFAAAGLELVEDHTEELFGTASRYLRVGRC